MVFDISIIEQPIRVVMESDLMQNIIAITSIIIAGTAVIALFKSNRATQIQLKLSSAEFRHRTRPILARHIYKKELHNVSMQIDGDTYSLTPKKVLFHFINNGTMNATNMRITSFIDSATFYQSPYFNPENKINSGSIPDLAPTEYYSIDIEWSESDFYNSKENDNCYFALIIWYADDMKTEYYYHMEGHFDKRMLMINHMKTGILKENNQAK